MFPGVVGKMEGDWEGAGLLRREKGIKLGACPVLIDLGEGAVPGPVAEGKGGGTAKEGGSWGKICLASHGERPRGQPSLEPDADERRHWAGWSATERRVVAAGIRGAREGVEVRVPTTPGCVSTLKSRCFAPLPRCACKPSGELEVLGGGACARGRKSDLSHFEAPSQPRNQPQ